MAGAYAALLSLSTVINNIQNHPNHPIFLHKRHVQTLVGKIAFLKEFLEVYSHNEATDGLGSLIRDAAYTAEDAIEFYLVDQISGSMNSVDGGNRVYQDLQKVIEDLDMIEKRTLEMKEKIGDDENHQQVSSMCDAPLVSPSPSRKSIMVGFDGVLNETLDKLIGYGSSSLKIIPIFGMGGIGKTTLALNAYEHARTVDHFDIRSWVTISQKYKLRDILVEIIHPRQRKNKDIEKVIGHMNEEQFGEMIYQRFFGRRYLIVLDDIWGTEIWDRVKHFFPNNNNGSKIIITTRISSVAFQLSKSIGVQLNFLNKKKSWDLLCKTVFEKNACPLELQEIGKIIANNCKGLPLSIVVIGGLLKKSKKAKEYWEYIAANISSIVNEEEDQRCLKILHISYRQLPINLKSCFLYMGVYPEDARIRVSWLIKLLVAEGFVEPIGGRTIEDVAKEFIKELADRNLILIDSKGITGDIKYCKVHDLLRDLSIREAHKEKFLSIYGEKNFDSQEGISTPRRIAAHRTPMKEYPLEVTSMLQSAFHARSIFIVDLSGQSWCFSSRLLRILKATDHAYILSTKKSEGSKGESDRGIFRLYNMRFLAVRDIDDFAVRFAYSLPMFWNLQTLIVGGEYRSVTVPVDIWKLTQLRHVEIVIGLQLANPPNDNLILWNLLSLALVKNLICSEEVVKRIPNIQKLEIEYDTELDYSDSYLENIQHLHKLESFEIFDKKSKACMSTLQQKLVFPCSLKKLYIQSIRLHWEDVTTMIGSLPCLEKLTLDNITGSEWKPLEGQFLSLKKLNLYHCRDLKSWIANSSHFPLLESVCICNSQKLVEIPTDIGEIPTLLSIQLFFCCDSAIISAKKIAEEQEELGNSKLVFGIVVAPERNELERLDSHKFVVTTSEFPW